MLICYISIRLIVEGVHRNVYTFEPIGKLCSARRCDPDGEERASLLQMYEAASLGEVGRKGVTYGTVNKCHL